MINLNNTSKFFTTDTVQTSALAGVDLEIKQGEFVAIVGPSGSGKSTLLNILGFIDTPCSGSYCFNGVETANLKESQRLVFRRQVGFVFQKFNLIDSLSIRENIRVPLLCQAISKADQDAKVEAMMKSVGITHRADHKPYQLSGGQQQRAAIARALVSEPELILADEPTGNLDSENGDEIFAMLKELHQSGTTVVMVTHNNDLANSVERQVHIRDGKIAA